MQIIILCVVIILWKNTSNSTCILCLYIQGVLYYNYFWSHAPISIICKQCVHLSSLSRSIKQRIHFIMLFLYVHKHNKNKCDFICLLSFWILYSFKMYVICLPKIIIFLYVQHKYYWMLLLLLLVAKTIYWTIYIDLHMHSFAQYY